MNSCACMFHIISYNKLLQLMLSHKMFFFCWKQNDEHSLLDREWFTVRRWCPKFFLVACNLVEASHAMPGYVILLHILVILWSLNEIFLAAVRLKWGSNLSGAVCWILVAIFDLTNSTVFFNSANWSEMNYRQQQFERKQLFFQLLFSCRNIWVLLRDSVKNA